MRQTAKLVGKNEEQFVRLPDEYRFPGSEVYIRRDNETGDVILSSKPFDWRGFFAMCDSADIPADFMGEADRSGGEHRPDPLGWYDK